MAAVSNKHLDTLLEGEILDAVSNSLNDHELEDTDTVVDDPEAGSGINWIRSNDKTDDS